MGQANQRKRAFLARHPYCIFCGGTEPATTIDHQPARSLFDRREWPAGYEFPACEPCNQASKEAEHKLALLVRIDAREENDPIRQREFQKYIVGMRNNFPNLLTPLSANQKRAFLKSHGIKRPPGFSLAEFHAAGINASASIELFEIAINKLLRALHWKHSGKIIQHSEGIKATWYTNAYFRVFQESDEAPFYLNLPAQPPITRNNRNISDQFFYRYGKDDTGDLAAFLIVFRGSFLITGIIAQSDELLTEIRAQTGQR